MKNKFRILITLIATFILAAFILSGCSAKSANSKDGYSEIKDKGFIVVGLDDTFAPMGFRDEKGEVVGFDVDLAKEVFKRNNLEVKFQPIDWSMKETELNTGNIDAIWNGYTITDERKEKVAFTNPYLENRQVIITLANSSIKSKKDLKDKIVAAQNESSSVDAMNKEPEVVSSLKNGEIIVLDTNNEAFMDLEAGRIDAVVADEILARYYISQRGVEKYAVLEDDFGKEEYGIGIRKTDKELLAAIEKALDEMRKDGTAAEISKKWFGDNIIR
ncbi:MAG: ABC-type transporter, periplasmic subunit family 3 [Clostridia bacterium]|jgi:polar amino acid transport system substrate-binding protein|nr:ABC-type transporter, periplasmic subunit family 3 [Clostridia bacterium]